MRQGTTTPAPKDNPESDIQVGISEGGIVTAHAETNTYFVTPPRPGHLKLKM